MLFQVFLLENARELHFISLRRERGKKSRKERS
jgi:hypothetical protein